MTREEAKREILFAKREVMADSWIDKAYDVAIKALEEPERKTGHWTEKNVIHEVESSSPIEEWQSAKCSVCGKYHTTPYLYYFDDFAFCPNCGSPMEGGVDGD